MTPPPVHVTAPTNPAEMVRSRVVGSVRAVAAGEPGLTAVGCAGIVVAVVCLGGVATLGRFVAPEGKLLDAATFSFGVGLYTLSVAALLPLAGFSTVGRRRWRRAFYVFITYGLVLESLQSFRGLDPRFTEAGGTIDVVAGIVFGVAAALNTVLFVLLGGRFFLRCVLADRPLLRLGIRYGVVAVAISFAIGIVMSVNSGRHVGEEGNLLVAHGLGVHGLQVMPLIALLATHAGLAQPCRWVHVAGGAWLTACLAALAQALLGRPPAEVSAVPAITVVALAVWVACAVAVARGWLQACSWRPASTAKRERHAASRFKRRSSS